MAIMMPSLGQVKEKAHFFGRSQNQEINFYVDVTSSGGIHYNCNVSLSQLYPLGGGVDSYPTDHFESEIVNVTEEYCDTCYNYEPICREKTECEKRNPDYFLECLSRSSEHSDCWQFAGRNDVMGECAYICLESICRKKTIYDYSCEELKQHIWIEEPYCASSNGWGIFCFGSSLYVSDIKKIYLEKGCEI